MSDYLYLPKNPNEYVIITTNGIVKKNGEAVMGAGLAKLASEHYQGLPKQLARHLERYGNRCFIFPKYNLITFPTKHHFKDKSDDELINKSLSELKIMIHKFGITKVYMPRIGCLNGGLDWKYVKSIIEFWLRHEIDDDIVVYTEP
jgi:hypothetical protein